MGPKRGPKGEPRSVIIVWTPRGRLYRKTGYTIFFKITVLLSYCPWFHLPNDFQAVMILVLAHHMWSRIAGVVGPEKKARRASSVYAPMD